MSNKPLGTVEPRKQEHMKGLPEGVLSESWRLRAAGTRDGAGGHRAGGRTHDPVSRAPAAGAGPDPRRPDAPQREPRWGQTERAVTPRPAAPTEQGSRRGPGGPSQGGRFPAADPTAKGGRDRPVLGRCSGRASGHGVEDQPSAVDKARIPGPTPTQESREAETVLTGLPRDPDRRAGSRPPLREVPQQLGPTPAVRGGPRGLRTGKSVRAAQRALRE